MPASDPPTEHISSPQPESGSSKPLLDSNGWDGKLRHPSKATGTSSASSDCKPSFANPEALTDPDYSDSDAPPPDVVPADEDLLDDYPTDSTDIDLVHCRISSIPSLRLSRFIAVERLCLRQNTISAIEFPESFGQKLQDLDLYDNLIKHVDGLEGFAGSLESLDLSFNKIKRIQGVDKLKELRDLYLVQNRIQKIEGLESLGKLRMLELAANRIRDIENLENLTSIEELWLGKNKIAEIKNLSTLTSLKLLSIQSNRLTSISGLSALTNLEELYISHNALTQISGLDTNTRLRVLDISNNPISHLENLSHLSRLEELWASNCQIGDFAEMERELKNKQELTTVYFEGNPLQTKGPAVYRNKIRLALPQVKQIDATYVRVS